jgi:spore coat polysaccharide biosynthesis protein SpsF
MGGQVVKTLVVIQARLGSTRFPGKILLPLAGRPLLERMIERVRAATTPGAIVVATTTDPADRPIKELCSRLDVVCFRGHPTDLLDRHYRVARQHKADVVVKIPSDCPLIDPAVVDRVIGYFHANPGRFDYVSNLHPPSYPDGNDVEVMSLAALEEAWKKATKSFEREHTTPYLWEHPERFRIGNIHWDVGLDYAMTHRWTIDYPEDYLLVKAVFEDLWEPGARPFSVLDILLLLQRRPDIAQLNARYVGVNWYRHHAAELKTISPNAFNQIVENPRSPGDTA